MNQLRNQASSFHPISSIVLSILFTALTGTGCGQEIKLSVRADEKSKDEPSTALVRRVEINYHDQKGTEKARTSIPVLGLAQPVSVQAGLFRELEVETGGVFEARGYSADNLLLLLGSTQVTEDHDSEYEILMSREENQAAQLGSPLLRKIRILNSSKLAAYSADFSDFRNSSPTQPCVALPPIEYDGETGVYPSIVFESTIKAPPIHYRLRNARNDQTLTETAINGAGDGAILINPIFFKRHNIDTPSTFELELFTGSNNLAEGCITVQLTAHPLPPSLSITHRQAWGRTFSVPVYNWDNLFWNEPVYTLHYKNPTANALHVRVTGQAFTQSNQTPVGLCAYPGAISLPSREMKCGSLAYTGELDLRPNSQDDMVAIYGVQLPPSPAPNTGAPIHGFQTNSFRVNWTIESWTKGVNGGLGTQLPTQTWVDFVP